MRYPSDAGSFDNYAASVLVDGKPVSVMKDIPLFSARGSSNIRVAIAVAVDDVGDTLRILKEWHVFLGLCILPKENIERKQMAFLRTIMMGISLSGCFLFCQVI